MRHPKAEVAALILALGCAGCCSKPKGSGSSPAPPPTAAPTPSKREILIAPGHDTPPARWTTPDKSRRAAPSFAQRFGYAPQLDPATKKVVYEAAAPKPRPKTKGHEPCLVICHVGTLRSEDNSFIKGFFGAGGNDIDLHVTRDRNTSLLAPGPDDRSWLYASVPLVDCSQRAPWTFRAMDRDGASHTELIGSLRIVPSFPVSAKNRSVAVECRSVPKDEVERELDRALFTCDEELTAVVDELYVDPSDATFGVEPQLTRLQHAVSQPAGWVGWSDPRVLRRRDWALRILDALYQDRKKLVREKAADAPRDAHFKFGKLELDVEVEDVSCDAAVVSRYGRPRDPRTREEQPPPACVVFLSTLNYGPGNLSGDLARPLGWRPVIARDDGQTLPMSFLDYEGAEVTEGKKGRKMIAPNAEARVVFGVGPEAFEKGHRPVLLVMNPFMGRETVFLSLPVVKKPVADGGAPGSGTTGGTGGTGG
ncbi:MAG: hypothetical protein ACOC1F_00760 [Myxococcota bacterium]